MNSPLTNPNLTPTAMENYEFSIELAQERSDRTGEIWNLLLNTDAGGWDRYERKDALMAIIQYIRWGEEGLFEHDRAEGLVGKIAQAIR